MAFGAGPDGDEAFPLLARHALPQVLQNPQGVDRLQEGIQGSPVVHRLLTRLAEEDQRSADSDRSPSCGYDDGMKARALLVL